MTIEVVGQLKTVMVVAFGYIFFDAPWHSLATSSLADGSRDLTKTKGLMIPVFCEGCKGNKMV
jgi:hypothetical protein